MSKNKRSEKMNLFSIKLIILFVVFILGFILCFLERDKSIAPVLADNEGVITTTSVTTTPVTTTTRITTTTTKISTTTKVTTTTATTTITSEESYYDSDEGYYGYSSYNTYQIEEPDYYEYYQETIVPEDTLSDEIYYGDFEGTFYEGGYGTYGYSGRTLISGYSVASNYFPQGSIIRIEGSGLDGIYRVDDTGGMPSNGIDFYYQYGDVPSHFYTYGRLNIQVYLIG